MYNVRCSSSSHWKARNDFLLVLIELFSQSVTAEAPRAKIDRKSAISPQSGQSNPKFKVEFLPTYTAPYQPYSYVAHLYFLKHGMGKFERWVYLYVIIRFVYYDDRISYIHRVRKKGAT